MFRRVRGARWGLREMRGGRLGAERTKRATPVRRGSEPNQSTSLVTNVPAPEHRRAKLQMSQSAPAGFKRWAIFPRLDLIQSRLNRLNISIRPLLAPLGIRKDEA